MQGQYTLSEEVEVRRKEIRAELSLAQSNRDEKRIADLQREMRMLDHKLMRV